MRKSDDTIVSIDSQWCELCEEGFKYWGSWGLPLPDSRGSATLVHAIEAEVEVDVEVEAEVDRGTINGRRVGNLHK